MAPGSAAFGAAAIAEVEPRMMEKFQRAFLAVVFSTNCDQRSQKADDVEVPFEF